MWNKAANAWYERDRTAAAALELQDDDMDSLYSALVAELASGTMRLPVTMDMTLVARYFERFADHAVNIARRVVTWPGAVTTISPDTRLPSLLIGSPHRRQFSSYVF